MMVASVALAACDGPDVEGDSPDEAPQIEITLEEALREAEDGRPLPRLLDWGPQKVQAPPELLFASSTVQTAEGEAVASQVAGDLTPDQRRRLARPYTYLHEPSIYMMEAWSNHLGDGVVERGYRALRLPSNGPVAPALDDGPLEIRPEVEQAISQIAQEDPSQLVDLDLEIRGFPEWDVPLPPDAHFMAAADVEQELAYRQAALDARRAMAQAMASPIIAAVEAAGGQVVNLAWKAGWVQVRVPAAALPKLRTLKAIARIDGEWGKSGGPGGPMSIGTSRDAYYQGADRFLNAGYDGKEPNPARHGYGRITIGMFEPNGYESGACAFMNGPGCAGGSRVRDTFRCDNSASNRCLPGSVHTNTSADDHGTITTSIALGDYTDGQGNGRAYGDPNWTQDTCTSGSQCGSGICENGECAHSDDWENLRTGMAPEAYTVLFGRVTPNTASSYTDMFDDAMDLGLDITNSSWGYGSQDCSLRANTLLEQEVENAYDDGVFVVQSAGNDNGDDATSCTIREPVALPKNFVVNAYDADDVWCQWSPSRWCRLDRDSCPGGIGCSGRGGATAVTPGGTYPDAVSVVDLVAPNDVTQFTWPTSGSEGWPEAGSQKAFGTSMAAPFVSGAAALVKDQYLAGGQTWLNDPGVLHTLMLNMGDRHFSADPSGTSYTSQLTATPDKWYGLGRLRMRLLESGQGMAVWANYVASLSFGYCGQTCGGGYGLYPFGTSPLPSSVRLAKCVLHQMEDMSSKSDVSRLTLRMEVLPAGGGAALYTRTSSNVDLKKVTAIEGNVFGGNIIAVTVSTNSVTTAGVSTRINCYISDIQDDASQ